MIRTIRLLACLLCAGLLAACAPTLQQAGRPDVGFTGPRLEPDAFISFDGARLGLSRWDAADAAGRPAEPWAVVIGVHGMNDYGNAFHLAAPWWASRGVTTLAYDQRGFGRSPHRGLWAPDRLRAEDLRTLTALARRRWPRATIAVVGESLGGATAIEAFADDPPPQADRLVLLAPAVWGWKSQPPPYRALLWLAAKTEPGKVFTPPSWLVRKVYPTDNMAELRDMGRDRLMIWGARSDSLYGLVATMQRASDDAAKLRPPTLWLYGARDPIIPRGATTRAVRRLAPTIRTGFYPNGFHLLMRDKEGPIVWRDVLAFIEDPHAPSPSGVGPIPAR